MKTELLDMEFSLVAWHELSQQSRKASRKIEEIINVLPLSNYGTGLNHIFFVHIIIQPDDIIHKNRKRYEKKSKILYISWKVDYDKFVLADEKTAISLMLATYLDCIEMFAKWRVPDFDAKRFYQDVKKLFEAY